jgi:hypothetical protein
LGGSQAFAVQEAAQVLADLSFRPRRYPVQHHSHHDVPAGCVQEQFPGNSVGVAVGRGDEDPQIRSGEELPGELSVVVGDGVDVGGIQECDSLGQCGVGYEDKRGHCAGVRDGAGARGRDRAAGDVAADPAEAGQDALALKPGRL